MNNRIPGVYIPNINNNTKHIKLNKGEIICPNCKGERFIDGGKINLFSDNYLNKHFICVKCKGVGKIDWIDNLVSKEDNIPDTTKISLNYINHFLTQILERNRDGLDLKTYKTSVEYEIYNFMRILKDKDIISDFTYSDRLENKIDVHIRIGAIINSISFKINIE